MNKKALMYSPHNSQYSVTDGIYINVQVVYVLHLKDALNCHMKPVKDNANKHKQTPTQTINNHIIHM